MKLNFLKKSEYDSESSISSLDLKYGYDDEKIRFYESDQDNSD